MAIDEGEGVTITGVFTDDQGDAQDPTTPVTVVVRNRGGDQEEIQATRQSEGTFSVEYASTEPGTHYYTFYSSDDPPAIDQGTFIVKKVVAKKDN